MKKKKLQLGNKPTRTFEIVVQLRDRKGNPTGRTKSFSHDNPAKIAEFWNRMRGRPKRKRKINKNAPLPKGKEADKIAQDMAGYAKGVAKKKRHKQEE